MFIYKTKILKTDAKWFSDKADEGDISKLDELLNEQTANGWELVTYSYMATSMQIKGAFVITFRKHR